MKCFFHPDREAIATCVECGKPVCNDCRNKIYGRNFCDQCARLEASKHEVNAPNRLVTSVTHEKRRPSNVRRPTGQRRSSSGNGAYVGGGCLSLFGFMMTIGALGSGLHGMGDFILFLVMGIAPLIGGGMIIGNHIKKNKRLKAEKTERILLGLAEKHNGRLTATVVAAESPLSLAEADKLLKEMASNGFVEMEVDNRGIIIYQFASLLPELEDDEDDPFANL